MQMENLWWWHRVYQGADLQGLLGSQPERKYAGEKELTLMKLSMSYMDYEPKWGELYTLCIQRLLTRLGSFGSFPIVVNEMY